MSGVKWETGGVRAPIAEVECVSETALSVVIKRENLDNRWREEKVKKNAEYRQFHNSWEEAHLYLIAKYESKVADLRSQLERAKSILGNVKGMKKPPEVAK